MRPVLLKVPPLDFGQALIVDLVLFGLLMGWRRVARAVGEDVPPLTAAGVLSTWAFASVMAIGIWWATNRFGAVEVKSYGAMLVVAFVAATAWCIRDGRRQGYEAATFIDLAVYVLIGGIIGARALYVVLDWSTYGKAPGSILALWEGGLSFHGGVMGSLLAGWMFARGRGLNFWKLADVVAPSVALGYGLGRIGCFLNGCCYGTPTSLPWGVRFPNATWSDGTPLTQPVHPTQLYAAAAGFLMFGLLLWLRGYARRSGMVFAMFLMLYSVYRFAIEFLRRQSTGRPLSFLPALTEAQLASALLCVLCGVWLIVAARGTLASKDEGRRTG